jgi:hypothetical protein
MGFLLLTFVILVFDDFRAFCVSKLESFVLAVSMLFLKGMGVVG